MNSAEPLPALVLAGRRADDDPIVRAHGGTCKSLVPIAGRPMIEWVIEALERSGRVGPVAISLDPATAADDIPPGIAARLGHGGLRRIDAVETPVMSVAAAFDHLADSERLLVTTADHPLLTPAMVGEFLDGAHTLNTDVTVALVAVDRIRAGYPAMRRTGLGFRDGARTGCNLFMLRGTGARNALAFWRRMEAHRKRPWRMALELGPLTAANYLLGRLTLASALERVGRRAGARLGTVAMTSAEAGIDVDSLTDFEVAERLLSARSDS